MISYPVFTHVINLWEISQYGPAEFYAYTIQRSSIPFSELVERYGDLSLAEFVDLCIENGLIPLPPVFTSIEQLTLYPGNSVIFNVSGQSWLAA